MLHVVVLTHGPQTCPGVDHQLAHQVMEQGARMDEVFKANGCTTQGVYVDRSNHSSWAIVDAPNGHAVDKSLREAGLVDWNVATVHPVVPIQEAMAELAQAHAH